jgi:predicted phosphodiesterase
MIRILSDLHVYDDRTRVRDLDQLEPLLVGVRTLIINGDSCEMRRGIGPAEIERMRKFFSDRVPNVTFVTGNHDPDISEVHEIMLAGDRVWVTHGDVCFDDLTPWSRKQPELASAVRRLLSAEPAADYRDPATRLRIARAAARQVGNDIDPTVPGLAARLVRFSHTFFPPRQPLAMIRAWRTLPGRASALAAQRSTTQVVVMGHSHFPGVWVRPPGPAVVNTGSFFHPLGGHLVDLSNNLVQVRRIQMVRHRFQPGRRVAEIRLKPFGQWGQASSI